MSDDSAECLLKVQRAGRPCFGRLSEADREMVWIWKGISVGSLQVLCVTCGLASPS